MLPIGHRPMIVERSLSLKSRPPLLVCSPVKVECNACAFLLHKDAVNPIGVQKSSMLGGKVAQPVHICLGGNKGSPNCRGLVLYMDDWLPALVRESSMLGGKVAQPVHICLGGNKGSPS